MAMQPISIPVVFQVDKKQLDKMRNALKPIGKSGEEAGAAVKAGMSKAQSGTEEATESAVGFSEAIAGIAPVARIASAAIIGAIGAVTVKAMMFESKLREVAHAANVGWQGAREYGDEILRLASRIPVATGELTSLVATSLRFGTQGSSSVMRFANTVGMMAAITGRAADELGEDMTMLIRRLGVADEKVENLASAIIALESNIHASTHEIKVMATEIDLLAGRMDWGESVVLGMSAAFAEMGARSRDTRSFVERLMEPGRAEDWADALGLPLSRFQRMVEETPVDLFRLVNRIWSEQGDEAKRVADILDRRTLRGLDALTVALPRIEQAIGIANAEMENAVAIYEEFDIVMDDLGQRSRIMVNRLDALVTVVGKAFIPHVTKLVSGLNESISSAYRFLQANQAILGPIAAVALGVGGLTAALGALTIAIPVATFLFNHMSATFASLTGTTINLTGAKMTLTAAIMGVGRAWQWAIGPSKMTAAAWQGLTVSAKAVAVAIGSARAATSSFIAQNIMARYHLLRFKMGMSETGIMVGALSAAKRGLIATNAGLALALRASKAAVVSFAAGTMSAVKAINAKNIAMAISNARAAVSIKNISGLLMPMKRWIAKNARAEMYLTSFNISMGTTIKKSKLLGNTLIWLSGLKAALIKKTKGLTLATAGYAAMTAIAKGAAKAFMVLLASKLLLLAPIAAIGFALYKLRGHMKNVNVETTEMSYTQRDARQAMEETQREMTGYADSLERLFHAGEMNNQQQESAVDAIDKLEAKYGDLGISVNSVTGEIDGMNEGMQVLNDRMAEQKERALENEYQEARRNVIDLRNEQAKLVEQLDRTWISPGAIREIRDRLEEIGDEVVSELERRHKIADEIAKAGATVDIEQAMEAANIKKDLEKDIARVKQKLDGETAEDRMDAIREQSEMWLREIRSNYGNFFRLEKDLTGYTKDQLQERFGHHEDMFELIMLAREHMFEQEREMLEEEKKIRSEIVATAARLEREVGGRRHEARLARIEKEYQETRSRIEREMRDGLDKDEALKAAGERRVYEITRLQQSATDELYGFIADMDEKYASRAMQHRLDMIDAEYEGRIKQIKALYDDEEEREWRLHAEKIKHTKERERAEKEAMREMEREARATMTEIGFVLGQALGARMDVTPNAKGNIMSGGRVRPFAKGGVVDEPTVFPMRKGAGLMGEAGPEAIMPLSRGAGGELGVKVVSVEADRSNVGGSQRGVEYNKEFRKYLKEISSNTKDGNVKLGRIYNKLGLS